MAIMTTALLSLCKGHCNGRRLGRANKLDLKTTKFLVVTIILGKSKKTLISKWYKYFPSVIMSILYLCSWLAIRACSVYDTRKRRRPRANTDSPEEILLRMMFSKTKNKKGLIHAKNNPICCHFSLKVLSKWFHVDSIIETFWWKNPKEMGFVDMGVWIFKV